MILERPNDLAQETSDAVMSAVRLAGDRWSSITSELPSGRELASSGRELAGEATTALSKALDQSARREAQRRRRMIGGLILGGLAAALLVGWLVRRQSARMTAQAEARRIDRQDIERAAGEGMGGAIGAPSISPVPMDMSAPDEDRSPRDAVDELDGRLSTSRCSIEPEMGSAPPRAADSHSPVDAPRALRRRRAQRLAAVDDQDVARDPGGIG